MPHAITELLHEWNRGDSSALDRLTPHVYQELRSIAGRALAGEQHRPIHPTELVHELFLRIRTFHSPNWRDRVHFFGAAAEQMRRVLVDLARRRRAAKRHQPMHASLNPPVSSPLDFEALDRALNRLAAFDPRQAKLVDLRFFAGLSIEETADVMGISPATVKREWMVAKAWLLHQLGG